MLTLEQWEAKYRPIINTINDNASFQDEDGNGILFETYGAEYDKVVATTPEKVWTYVDGDDGTYVVAGWCFVNRIGYFITEEPWETMDIEIQVSEDEHEDD